MAKKLSRIAMRPMAINEDGFVLATSLVLLSLLTLLAVGVMYSGNVALQTSASARDGTEAFYYAETGIHYMAWALNNDAEFDSYAPVVKRTGGPCVDHFCEPPLPPGAVAASTVGDRYELFANLPDPGPTAISDTSTAGTTGQIMYFDNTPLASRAVCWGGSPGCASKAGTLVFDSINQNLPRYIMLEIDTGGNITPTIPALLTTTGPPFHGAAVGTDVPNNGVILWITAGDKNEDAEILSLTDAACLAAGIPAGQSCYQGASATNPTAFPIYGIVAYAIGYVNGKALRMIRAVIM